MGILLTDMTEKEIEEKIEDMKEGKTIAFTDQSNYYGDKLYETAEKMSKLMTKENEKMIEQNEKERVGEIGDCCFETATKESKVFQKVSREKR